MIHIRVDAHDNIKLGVELNAPIHILATNLQLLANTSILSGFQSQGATLRKENQS
jgi:hypothetical protein